MKVLTAWRKSTEELAKAFVKKYFPGIIYGMDTYWVCDRVGDVFFVCDYFFNLDRMVECLENKVLREDLLGYYDIELEYGLKNSYEYMPINFNNYIGLKISGDFIKGKDGKKYFFRNIEDLREYVFRI